MHTKTEKQEAFGRLLDIMDELREKCPWDRKQTMQSLRHFTLEESYELSDALLEEDMDEIKKELGDVLMHLVFYAKIGSEKGKFDIVDVINSLCEKLIYRHPHIYGDAKADDAETVKQNWEKLKLKEGNKSVLSGVPKGLPSMIKAYRIQDKVRGVGFDFPNEAEAWKKVEEELSEFHAETEKEKNYSRIIGLNPDSALEKTNLKFISRFQEMEKLAQERNLVLSEMSLEQMDELWDEAKKNKN